MTVFGDVVSSNNVVGFYSFFNAFSNQQPIIDVLIINLIDFLGIELTPLGFFFNQLELMHMFCFLFLMC
jgi:hypothetical protein